LVDFASLFTIRAMRDLLVLLLHFVATVARLGGPGGARSVVAESVLLKHQLLILNRAQRHAPNLYLADRIIAGVCTLLMRPKAADPFRDRPQTLDALAPPPSAQAAKISPAVLINSVEETGPEGTSPEVIAAVVEMKQRNPTWGCPRIAQQIALAFGISLNKDVVRRILAARCQPPPAAGGPSWLTEAIGLVW
jgi:hypothetical protein